MGYEQKRPVPLLGQRQKEYGFPKPSLSLSQQVFPGLGFCQPESQNVEDTHSSFSSVIEMSIVIAASPGLLTKYTKDICTIWWLGAKEIFALQKLLEKDFSKPRLNFSMPVHLHFCRT